jgi:hypothetical protein
MVFRMGLHVGDIVGEQERIYGTAVNLAARLERVAEGGGLCISGTVYDHVMTRLPLEYSALGVWIGQGTPAPIRVYRVQIEPTVRPPIRRVRAQYSHVTWPRARRMVRAALRYLGRYVRGWVGAANYPVRRGTRSGR